MNNFREKVASLPLYRVNCELSEKTLEVPVLYGSSRKSIHYWIQSVLEKCIENSDERSIWWQEHKKNWDIVYEKLCERSRNKRLADHLDTIVRTLNAIEYFMDENTLLPHPNAEFIEIGDFQCTKHHINDHTEHFSRHYDDMIRSTIGQYKGRGGQGGTYDPFMCFYGHFATQMCEMDRMEMFEPGTFSALFNAFKKMEDQYLESIGVCDVLDTLSVEKKGKKNFKLQLVGNKKGGLEIPDSGITLQMKKSLQEGRTSDTVRIVSVLCVYEGVESKVSDDRCVMTIFDNGGGCFHPLPDTMWFERGKWRHGISCHISSVCNYKRTHHSKRKTLNFIQGVNSDTGLEQMAENTCCCMFCGTDRTIGCLEDSEFGSCTKLYAASWSLGFSQKIKKRKRKSMSDDESNNVFNLLRKRSPMIQSMVDDIDTDDIQEVFDIIRSNAGDRILSIVSEWIDMDTPQWFLKDGMDTDEDLSNKKKSWHAFMYMLDPDVLKCLDYLDLRDKHGKPIMDYINQIVLYVYHVKALEQYTMTKGVAQYKPSEDVIFKSCIRNWMTPLLKDICTMYPDMIVGRMKKCLKDAIKNDCKENVRILIGHNPTPFDYETSEDFLLLAAEKCGVKDIFHELFTSLAPLKQESMQKIMNLACEHANVHCLACMIEMYPELDYKYGIIVMSHKRWFGMRNPDRNKRMMEKYGFGGYPSIKSYIDTLSLLVDKSNLKSAQGGNVFHFAAKNNNDRLLHALKHFVGIGRIPYSLLEQTDNMGKRPVDYVTASEDNGIYRDRVL